MAWYEFGGIEEVEHVPHAHGDGIIAAQGEVEHQPTPEERLSTLQMLLRAKISPDAHYLTAEDLQGLAGTATAEEIDAMTTEATQLEKLLAAPDAGRLAIAS